MRKKRNAAFEGYRTTERTPEAAEKLLFYCLAHLSSPSAVRRPQLSIRNGLWIALLGPQCGKRNCWNRSECGIGTPRFRFAIFKLSQSVGGSDKNSPFT